MIKKRTEADVRNALTLANYQAFLEAEYPKEVSPEDREYWNPITGSCGFHARFTYDALGVEEKDEFRQIDSGDIEGVVGLLDKGYVLTFLHNYPTDATFTHLPKDNRYGNHIFVLVKGGEKYFLSQGYLNQYKHSLTTLTDKEVKKMLEDIMTKLSDYENKKTWAEIDPIIHKKYFKTDLHIFPNRPILKNRKVHGIVLLMETAA